MNTLSLFNFFNSLHITKFEIILGVHLKSDWLTYWGVCFFEQLQEVMVGDTIGVVRVQLQH